jgi:hypothetical protein
MISLYPSFQNSTRDTPKLLERPEVSTKHSKCKIVWIWTISSQALYREGSEAKWVWVGLLPA